MIFSVITQSGTKIGTLNNTIYQYSDNLTFQFLRDAKFNEYTLGAYINYDDKIYGLEVSEDDTFKVDSRFLNEKKEFLLSFSLTNGEEIIHLGTINYRVKDAFGSTTSPLPGQKEVWTVLVEQEVDDYFLKNYQSQLDDFNQKYEEIKKIASSGSGGGSNVTVDTALSSTSTNPVQNKVIKAELDKKAAKNEIPTNLSSLNEDETHQTVTAEEKKKWDGKSDFDGDFNSLNNIPNIPDAVIVDAELNETSTNAIQNQAVAKELGKKIPKGGLKTINGESIIGSGDITISGESGNNAGYKLLYSKTYENVSKITENVDNINQYKDIIITVSLEIDNTIDEQDYSCILTWLVLGGVTVAYWKNVNMSKSYNYKHLIGKLKMSDDNKYIDIELSLNNSVAMLQYNNTTGVEEAKYFRRGVIMDENFQTNSLKVELNKELKEIKINIYGK